MSFETNNNHINYRKNPYLFTLIGEYKQYWKQYLKTLHVLTRSPCNVSLQRKVSLQLSYYQQRLRTYDFNGLVKFEKFQEIA